MSAPFRFPKFFVTNPSPCPYLRGKVERKVFTELNGRHASELNESLGRIGFRRSQSVAYRPSCIDCSACVSVRVLAAEFEASATQRKLLRRHADLEVTRVQAVDHRRAISAAAPISGACAIPAAAWPRWTRAISPTWSSRRRSAPTSSNIASRRRTGSPGKLVGACLSDQQSDGLSMIYSFFDVGPDARKGLGTFIILDHIVRAARAGLPYVYLGYWVEGSPRMAYKTGFRPLERLGRDGWRRMDEARAARSRPPLRSRSTLADAAATGSAPRLIER